MPDLQLGFGRRNNGTVNMYCPSANSGLNYLYTDGQIVWTYIDGIPYKYENGDWSILYSPPNCGRIVYADPRTKQYYYYSASAGTPKSLGNGYWYYEPVSERSMRVPLSAGSYPSLVKPMNAGELVKPPKPNNTKNWWSRLRWRRQ